MSAKFCLCAALVGVCPLFVVPAAGENSSWLIPADRARCIVQNAHKYAALEGDPLVIIVDACPEADLTAGLAATATNTGTTNVGSGVSVLILTKAELACLAKISLAPDADGFISIPKALTCD